MPLGEDQPGRSTEKSFRLLFRGPHCRWAGNCVIMWDYFYPDLRYTEATQDGGLRKTVGDKMDLNLSTSINSRKPLSGGNAVNS